MDILDYTLFDVDIMTWLIAIGLSLALAIVMMIVRKFIVRRFEKLANKTDNIVDDIIALIFRKTRRYAFFAVAAAVIFWFRQFPENVTEVVYRIAFLVLLIQAGIWGRALITWWVDYQHRTRMREDPAAVTTIRGIALIGTILLWSILLLLVLDNFGVDVTALVTGLGIGGIAVALAVQNILGDLFASLSIVIDKPFVIGDFLILGDHMGTVEDIGMKTTRIRSLSGEQIVISNGDLLKSRIRNYKRMEERRVVFTVGVVYHTPRQKLVAIPGVLKEIVEREEEIRFDRAHFKSFGDFALIFEVVYYVLKPDYGLFMDIQQSINLNIIERFESDGIEIAYPTQTLLVDVQSEVS